MPVKMGTKTLAMLKSQTQELTIRDIEEAIHPPLNTWREVFVKLLFDLLEKLNEGPNRRDAACKRVRTKVRELIRDVRADCKRIEKIAKRLRASSHELLPRGKKKYLARLNDCFS